MTNPIGDNIIIEPGINDIKDSEHSQFGPKVIADDGTYVTIEIRPGKTYKLRYY